MAVCVIRYFEVCRCGEVEDDLVPLFVNIFLPDLLFCHQVSDELGGRPIDRMGRVGRGTHLPHRFTLTDQEVFGFFRYTISHALFLQPGTASCSTLVTAGRHPDQSSGSSSACPHGSLSSSRSATTCTPPLGLPAVARLPLMGLTNLLPCKDL